MPMGFCIPVVRLADWVGPNPVCYIKLGYDGALKGLDENPGR